MSECVNEVCQYPYAAPIGSEIEVRIARDAVRGGHRAEYSDMLVEASGRCDWGLCCRLGGATAYRSMSVVWGQIYEQRLNLRRSWQQGHSTPYNTLFLAKSSAEDLSLSIFRLKSCMALGRSLLLRM